MQGQTELDLIRQKNISNGNIKSIYRRHHDLVIYHLTFVG